MTKIAFYDLNVAMYIRKASVFWFFDRSLFYFDKSFVACLELVGHSELYADWLINADIVAGVSKKACIVINLKHLNDFAIAAGSKQVFAIWCNGKVAWVFACMLVSDFGQGAFDWIDLEDGDPIVLESAAGI
jgi:hypothetical protein